MEMDGLDGWGSVPLVCRQVSNKKDGMASIILISEWPRQRSLARDYTGFEEVFYTAGHLDWAFFESSFYDDDHLGVYKSET